MFQDRLPLAFNLGSAFVVSIIPSLIDELLPYVDLLFANQSEALAYAAIRPRVSPCFHAPCDEPIGPAESEGVAANATQVEANEALMN